MATLPVETMPTDGDGERKEGASPVPLAPLEAPDVADLLLKARDLFSENRHEELLEVCEEILGDPAEPAAEFEDEEQIGRYFSDSEAFTAFSRAYRLCGGPAKTILWLSNHRAEAWFLRGYVLVEQEDFEGAAECFEQAILLFPAHLSARNELGYCYQELQQYEKAIEVFRQSIAACRAIPSTIRGLDCAATDSDDVESWNPHSEARAWRGVGFQFIELSASNPSLLKEAEQAFRRSLKLAPGNASARGELQYIRNRKLLGRAGAAEPAEEYSPAEAADPPAIQAIEEAIVATYEGADGQNILSTIWAAIEEGLSFAEVCDRGIPEGFRLAGERIPEEKRYVPETLLVCRHLEKALDEIARRIGREVRYPDHRVAIFGAPGDLHRMGSRVLSLLFREAGFPVCELGCDVQPDKVMECVRNRGVRILLGSATLSTTSPGLEAVALALKQESMQDGVAYLVGGEGVLPEDAQQMGADGYAANAQEAVAIAKRLWRLDESATEQPAETPTQQVSETQAEDIDAALAQLQAPLSRGEFLAEKNRHAEAIGEYDRGLCSDPRDAALLQAKAWSLIQLGQSEEAVNCYDLLLGIDSASYVARHNKAWALHLLGRHEEAIQVFDEAARIRPDTAALWRDKSRALAALQRWSECLECCERGLRLDPRIPILWHNKADALRCLGCFEDSLPAYEQVIALEPNNAGAYLGCAWSLENLGRWADVIRCSEMGLQLEPGSEALLRSRGCALLKAGCAQEAIECFTRVLAIVPGDVNALHNTGWAHYQLGQHEKALQAYDRALGIDASNSGLLRDKARCLEALQRFDQVLDCCTRGLKLSPADPDLWCLRGWALNALGRDALPAFQAGLQHNPENTGLWYGVGWILNHRRGQHEQACRCFDKALAGEPAHLDAWIEKAWALERLNRLPEAIQCLDRALAVSPRHHALLLQKAALLLELRKLEDALRCCEQAIDVEPGNVAGWRSKSYVLAELGRWAEVHVCCEQGLAVDPRDADLWNNKGWALAQRNRADLALIAYDTALRLRPDVALYWNNKGVALRQLGRESEAAECFHRAAELEAKGRGSRLP